MNFTFKGSITRQQSVFLEEIEINLELGEFNVLTGRNGIGKSSLLNALFGHRDYELKNVDSFVLHRKNIVFNLLNLSIKDKALAGIFMSFQNPPIIPEINTLDFLSYYYSCIYTENKDNIENKITELFYYIDLDVNLLKRGLNSDFSGGEKKKLEMIQLMLTPLDQEFVYLLDELDSNLDKKALDKLIEILQVRRHLNHFLIVSHNEEFLRKLGHCNNFTINGTKIVLQK